MDNAWPFLSYSPVEFICLHAATISSCLRLGYLFFIIDSALSRVIIYYISLIIKLDVGLLPIYALYRARCFYRVFAWPAYHIITPTASKHAFMISLSPDDDKASRRLSICRLYRWLK